MVVSSPILLRVAIGQTSNVPGSGASVPFSHYLQLPKIYTANYKATIMVHRHDVLVVELSPRMRIEDWVS